ncbi:hypothetical protein BJS_00468 [Bradyrhizobium japonicum SEMIA 5079]|nr:hypothetical protein BJS_00468 [Bradyrhizobium japonicum SEMIA 5079]
MWLLGRLAPDHKTIADFRKDNGLALRRVCARFVELCREMDLLATTSIAIDGSKFKAVNNRDRNFTLAKVERRRVQLEESVAQYLSQLDTADRQEPTEALAAKVTRLKEKLTNLKDEMSKLAVYEKQMRASPDQKISLTDPDSEEADEMLRRYWTNVCKNCSIKPQCTPGSERRITRWEHEDLLDAVQQRLDANPLAMRLRRETVEHPFGTMKARMGATHFLTRTLPKVATEMALSILAYNLTRAINILGIRPLIAAIAA